MTLEQFSTDIHCLQCCQCGVAFWEEGRTADGAMGRPAKLLRVSSGFHVDGKTRAGSPNVICDLCDSVLAD